VLHPAGNTGLSFSSPTISIVSALRQSNMFSLNSAASSGRLSWETVTAENGGAARNGEGKEWQV
jgi:hypothetical protein